MFTLECEFLGDSSSVFGGGGGRRSQLRGWWWRVYRLPRPALHWHAAGECQCHQHHRAVARDTRIHRGIPQGAKLEAAPVAGPAHCDYVFWQPDRRISVAAYPTNYIHEDGALVAARSHRAVQLWWPDHCLDPAAPSQSWAGTCDHCGHYVSATLRGHLHWLLWRWSGHHYAGAACHYGNRGHPCHEWHENPAGYVRQRGGGGDVHLRPCGFLAASTAERACR